MSTPTDTAADLVAVILTHNRRDGRLRHGCACGWAAESGMRHADHLAAEIRRADPRPPQVELLALHRVALQARDAVTIAAAAGVHLGPLRAALDETAYRVGAGGAR